MGKAGAMTLLVGAQNYSSYEKPKPTYAKTARVLIFHQKKVCSNAETNSEEDD